MQILKWNHVTAHIDTLTSNEDSYRNILRKKLKSLHQFSYFKIRKNKRHQPVLSQRRQHLQHRQTEVSSDSCFCCSTYVFIFFLELCALS